MLIALYSGLDNEVLKKLPSEIRILPWGKSEYDGGALVVNAASVNEIPRMQKAYNFDRLALDFNHNSLESSPSYKGEPVKVAAYATLEIRDGEGLFFKDIDWTKEGKEFVEGGHYADISPTVLTNDKGEVTFVHSAALCRQGRVPGLELFSADFLNQKQNHNIMEETLKKYKALLCTILGLDENSEDAAIEDAAKNFAEKLNKSGKATQANTEDENFKALSSRVAALESSTDEAVKQQLISEALSVGKVIPLSASALPLQVLKDLIKDSPEGILPLAARTPEGLKEFKAKTPLSESQSSVCAQLGISEETLNKYGE